MPRTLDYLRLPYQAETNRGVKGGDVKATNNGKNIRQLTAVISLRGIKQNTLEEERRKICNHHYAKADLRWEIDMYCRLKQPSAG
jgi:hypothetical protein